MNRKIMILLRAAKAHREFANVARDIAESLETYARELEDKDPMLALLEFTGRQTVLQKRLDRAIQELQVVGTAVENELVQEPVIDPGYLANLPGTILN